MAVSARSLFHFTKSAEYLVAILRNEFLPRFCLEDQTTLEVPLGFPRLEVAVPMVCFCDIPLSDIGEHLSFYGQYGLGLTKDWGIRQGLNPIVYLSPESQLNHYLGRVGLEAWNDEDDVIQHSLVELFSFTKAIQGKMYRNGEFIDRVFYDEREWRYVPRLWDEAGTEIIPHYRLSKDEYLDDVRRSNANATIPIGARLPFEPADIKYIIVREESEITSMIAAIRAIKSKYDQVTVDLLASRIISAEQVLSDF